MYSTLLALYIESLLKSTNTKRNYKYIYKSVIFLIFNPLLMLYNNVFHSISCTYTGPPCSYHNVLTKSSSYVIVIFLISLLYICVYLIFFHFIPTSPQCLPPMSFISGSFQVSLCVTLFFPFQCVFHHLSQPHHP